MRRVLATHPAGPVHIIIRACWYAWIMSRSAGPTVPQERAVRQWLARRPGRSVAEVAAHVVGLQAQEPLATRLQVRSRSASLRADDVRRACVEPGRLVRTWLMRGTLHLVAGSDVRWLLSLFGPRNAARGAGRRRQLGLDEDVCSHALCVLPELLTGSPPLSRAQVIEGLVGEGVRVDPTGQAPALLAYAAAMGVVCRGPDLDGDEPGYVLLDEWVPASAPVAQDEALAELARRYLAAFAPAEAADLAAWSALPLNTARRACGLAAADVEARAAAAGVARGAAEAAGGVAGAAELAGDHSVRLLGAFDTYLLGYRDRSLMLEPRFATRVQAGGGIIHPTLIVDGQVVGTWRLHRRKAAVDVAVHPFVRLDSRISRLVDEEAADVARFLGAPRSG